MMFPSCADQHVDDPPTDTSIISSNRLPHNLAKLRYGFQMALSLLVILFCMGCVVFDLAWNGTMTAISNVAWPTISFVLGLHFNIKKEDKARLPPPPARINIIQDPPMLHREDMDH